MSAIAVSVTPTSDAAAKQAGILDHSAKPKSRVLSVSANSADHTALHRMIDPELWQLSSARSCRNALRQLTKNVSVVFCECSLPDGSWKDILEYLGHMEKPPQLVVTSRLADAYLWSEVLNLGGFDVLAKPLLEKEVRQVLDSVSRFRSESTRRVRVAGMM